MSRQPYKGCQDSFPHSGYRKDQAMFLNQMLMGVLDSSLRPLSYTYSLNGRAIFREIALPSEVTGYAPMGVRGFLRTMGIEGQLRQPPVQEAGQSQTRYRWPINFRGKPGMFTVTVSPGPRSFSPTHQVDYFLGPHPYFTERSSDGPPTAADDFLRWMDLRRGSEIDRLPLKHGGGTKSNWTLVDTQGNERGLLIVDMVPLPR
jgi:hypothetical protein